MKSKIDETTGEVIQVDMEHGHGHGHGEHYEYDEVEGEHEGHAEHDETFNITVSIYSELLLFYYYFVDSSRYSYPFYLRGWCSS